MALTVLLLLKSHLVVTESAKKLNDELSQTFSENQIFRIDHYLGKEMVQNIQALRFGNYHDWNHS